MFKKIMERIKKEKTHNIGVFTECTLKTSFYEELQKNGWCDIVNDKPDNLIEIVRISIEKTVKL